MPGYEVWTFHGESNTRVIAEDEYDCDVVALIGWMRCLKLYEHTELEAFFKLLEASEEPLHEHTEVTLFAFITWLMYIKSKYFFFNNCYNDLVKLINDILMKPHKVPKDMHQSKKMMSVLGLRNEKIDVYPDNYMLFWK
jgi:hypothetical protein